ncbi:MAG TPA: hypothetical protein VGI96_08760 [Streptosporangiaceae bacterium]
MRCRVAALQADRQARPPGSGIRRRSTAPSTPEYQPARRCAPAEYRRPAVRRGPAPGTVTQALGGSDESAAVDPQLIKSPLSEDTSHLICTDGLTDPVPADVISPTLRQHQDGRAAYALWQRG